MAHSLKIKKKIKKFKEAGDSRHIYQIELDTACFQHDMAYGDFKDLNWWTAADKLLNIDKNPKYYKYQRGLTSMASKFFDKHGTVQNETISNKELAEGLHKTIIRTFNETKVHSPFTDNILGADLADMPLISKFNKRFRFLLCVIHIYSKYAWIIPFKDKKGITLTNAFQNILDESNRKPNKILLDKGSEFYNRSMNSFCKTMI